jgi:hypothetical protein
MAMTIGRIMAVAAGCVLLSAASAAAQGLVDLHDKVRVGNKLCMADHFHYGNSGGHPSKKAAEAAAVKSWEGFTGWEYGAAWGSFRLAESRGSKCDIIGGSWTCNVQARPCRRR